MVSRQAKGAPLCSLGREILPEGQWQEVFLQGGIKETVHTAMTRSVASADKSFSATQILTHL